MSCSKLPCYLLKTWKAYGQKSEPLSNQKVVIGIRLLCLKWGRSTQRFGKLAGSMDWRTVSSLLLYAWLSLTLSVALTRYAMVRYDLQNGTHIPPGSKVALDSKAIYFDPQIYTDPERCDLFRFSTSWEGGHRYQIRVRDPGSKCRPFSYSPVIMILKAISCFLS